MMRAGHIAPILGIDVTALNEKLSVLALLDAAEKEHATRA